MGILFILYEINNLRKERVQINDSLNELETKGLRVYRKKFEKLLYSRDVADLPKLGKLLFNYNTLAILQPNNLQELKECLKVCERFSIPIIPRGAGTGGYGGVIPTQNGIIIILTQLKEITSFNPETKTIEVETGITWSRLREFLLKKGYDLFTYPSSAPSSSIGGWIASGGYGIGSSKYGDIATSIHSMLLVGSDGEEYVLDKTSDFIGNFGTLGIVWKATLKLREVTQLHHIALNPQSNKRTIEIYNLLQKMDPYYLRYIDKKSLEWILVKDNKGINITNLDFGVLAATFFEKDWISSQEKLGKYDGVLPDTVSEDLWEDRFRTLRIKRGGPSLIISEVIIPSETLETFLEKLEDWFIRGKYSIEVVSLNDRRSMVMVWFLTDQRKFALPFIGSLPYLFHWFRSFQVIKIAWDVGGSTYNNGGLWLSPFPNEENRTQLNQIQKLKQRTDPHKLFNPGKIKDLRIPRFFPILPWGIFLKIGLPIFRVGYRMIPKRYR
jgi:FAD/FMN-containing dehydrogenase